MNSLGAKVHCTWSVCSDSSVLKATAPSSVEVHLLFKYTVIKVLQF